jgi:hypothetical protein
MCPMKPMFPMCCPFFLNQLLFFLLKGFKNPFLNKKKIYQ